MLILLLGANIVSAAFYIFAIAIVVLVLSIVFFLALLKIDFYKQHACDTFEKPLDEVKAVQSELTMFQIIQKTWVWILAIFLTYVTEMSVFPAITSLVVSTGTSEWSTKYFIPVGCFLIFFIGKFIGSTFARFTSWPRNTEMSSWFVLSIAIIRFAFIPLFLFCNIAPNQRVLSFVSIFLCLKIEMYCNGYMVFVGDF